MPATARPDGLWAREIAPRRAVLGWALSLYAAWTAVWIIYKAASARWPALQDHAPATVWWFVCKLVVWVVPIGFLGRRHGTPTLSWLGLNHTRGLGRGLFATLVFLLIVVLLDAAVPGRWPKLPDAQNRHVAIFLIIFIASPFFEELVFRGYALPALQRAGSSFWRANLETALLFALLHVPGWLFQGRGLAECLALGANIAFLGFLFGALRAGAASLWPSILIHVVNNLWHAGWFLLAADALKRVL